MTDPHAALIYTMVLVSAADTDMTDAELQIIGDVVNHLPVFRDYDRKRLTKDLKECAQVLGRDDGLEQSLKAISAGRSLRFVRHLKTVLPHGRYPKTIDEAAAARYPYDPAYLPVARLEDGTLWNW